MDARQHDDLIFTISQAILDARYAPPKRRRSAWGEGFEERPGAGPARRRGDRRGVTTERLSSLPRPTGTTAQHAQGQPIIWRPLGGFISMTTIFGVAPRPVARAASDRSAA
jgi:hypothetical protein